MKNRLIRSWLSAVFGVSLMVGGAGAARANFIVNGDFENALTTTAGVTSQAGGAYNTVDAGSTAINGWSVFGDSVDLKNTYWQAAHGTSSVDLDGTVLDKTGTDAQGGIKQTFATTAGQWYSVSYYVAGNPDGPPDTKHLIVDAAGQQDDFWFTKSGHTRDAMGWQQVTWGFLATSASTTLSFASGDPGQYGAAIDNVDVELADGPPTHHDMPEPASLTLLGLGALGLCGFKRLRRVK